MKRLIKIIQFYVFDAFLHFSGTNTPSFTKIPLTLNYDEYWNSRFSHMPMNLRRREKLVMDFIRENSRVMDFGCGVSPLLYYLKENKRCNVIGYDLSQKAVAIQKSKGVLAKKVHKTNYLMNSFDYIVATELLEHLTNPEELIDSFRNKTTYMIASIPNSAYFAYRLKLLLKGRISMQWMYHPSEHVRYWSHVEFIEWMDAMGYRCIKFKSVDGILSSINFLPNLFSWDVVYLFQVKK